jgi:HAD superfamily hydrolase (TIGR01450 family)
MTLAATTRTLAETFDVALLDLDGVVYVGPDAVRGAAQSLAQARDAGMRLAFVTNNAARPPEVVAAHLRELQIAATADEVVTSAQAAARHLAERLPAGSAVLVVGTVGLDEALRERGLRPVRTADEHPAAVVQGYSPTLDWALLAEGCIAIRRGVPWVATNLDPTVPSPRGPLPGNGALVAALRHATGAEPVTTGKPDPAMHRESVRRSAARNPVVVGDRLDTDIEGANAVGCPSLLVLSGVTHPVDLLAAPPPHRPSFVSRDLGGLLQRQHAPARVEDAGYGCGGWVARGTAAELHLAVSPAVSPVDGSDGAAGDELDALRALCAAAWDCARPAAHERVRCVPDDARAAAELSRLGLDAG